MNLASKYVKTSRENSPTHRFVADNGKGVARENIEHTTIAGRRVSISDHITNDEYTLIKEAIEATRPSQKSCFVNSLKMWEYDNRFEYSEGYAVMSDLNVGGIEHAWSMLHGKKLVDATEAFDHYHGAIISDPDTLDRYTGSNLTGNGIIGNHKNRYEFLRERGYFR